MTMGRYQLKALVALSAAGQPQQFWEMPNGVTPDVICKLAAKGMVTASISLTAEGIAEMERTIEQRTAEDIRMAAAKEKYDLRVRMRKSKAPNLRLATISRPVAVPVLVAANDRPQAKTVLEPSGIAPVSIQRLMGAR